MQLRKHGSPTVGRLVVIGGACLLLLLLLATWQLYVRESPAAIEDLRKIPPSNNRHSASSAPADTGPALTRKPRPPSRKDDRPPEMPPEVAEAMRIREVLGDELDLTDEFIEASGLTPSQAAAAREVLGREWTEISEWAASHLAYDEAASTEAGEGARVFRLEAMPESERLARADRLAQSLAGAVPPAAAKDIMACHGQRESFGLMGRFSCEIRYLPGILHPEKVPQSSGSDPADARRLELCWITAEGGKLMEEKVDTAGPVVEDEDMFHFLEEKVRRGPTPIRLPVDVRGR